MSVEAPTDHDVMKAIVLGCNQGHAPSIESARRLLVNLSQGPPETLATVFEVLLEGGVFTDEEIAKPPESVGGDGTSGEFEQHFMQ